MRIFNKKTKNVYNPEKKNKMINFEHLNKNYCKMGQTVLVGDSITEILNHTELYAEYIKENNKCVYNRGISGDTSNRLLERFEKNVLNLKPSNIVLLIGINDFNSGLTMDETVSNIDKMLSLISENCSGANVVLQAVYPVNEKMRKWDKGLNKKVKILNDRLKALAKTHGTAFLDLTDLLSDENGNLKERYTYDGLHPTVFGYEVVVKNAIPLLK